MRRPGAPPPSGLSEWIRATSAAQFSKSSGPGGQNVNRVNTKVTLKLKLSAEAPSPLTEIDIERIKEKLKNRISGSDELVIQTDSYRHQYRNRELAYKKMIDLITSALKRQKKRLETKPSSASKERRLTQKKRKSYEKSLRKPVRPEE